VYQWPVDLERVLPADLRGAPPPFPGTPLPTPLQQILRAGLGGDLILSDDEKYANERRVFNQAFDPFPAGIAICSSETQVALCLKGVRDFNIPFCVRGSGHSFTGCSSVDDALVIDLRKFNDVQVDSAQAIVMVGAGCTHSVLDASLEAQGLRLSLGADPLTVGGFMQGGGYGLFARTLGMNCDSVLEVRVMLADGRIVTANENLNHDLWWAVRGGTGGNFGVLLSIKYQARARIAVASRALTWNLTNEPDRSGAAQAIMNAQSILKTAPPELSLQVDVRYHSSTPVMTVSANFFGSKEELNRLLTPLLVASLLSSEDTNLEVTKLSAIPPFVRHSRFVSELQLNDWRALLDNFLTDSNHLSSLTIDGMGGAINSFPIEKSAFVHRDSMFNVYVTGFWIKGNRHDKEVVDNYIESWSRLIAPFWNGRVFQNFPYPDLQDYYARYWGNAFPALFAVKRKYDPSRMFTFAQAIDTGLSAPPAPTSPPRVVEWLIKPIAY
jgi:hypothetical protein